MCGIGVMWDSAIINYIYIIILHNDFGAVVCLCLIECFTKEFLLAIATLYMMTLKSLSE